MQMDSISYTMLNVGPRSSMLLFGHDIKIATFHFSPLQLRDAFDSKDESSAELGDGSMP